MGEKPSPGLALSLVAVVLAVAAVAVSLTSLYLMAPQKAATATSTTTSTAVVTTTLTTTVWQGTTTTGPAPSLVSVLGSRGSPGMLEEPQISYIRVEDYVLVIYREQASVPCYRHVVAETKILERWPPIIDITLELERTSEICIEVIAVIESVLRVGPLDGPDAMPDGTDIVVNGLRIVVSD